MLKKIKQHKDEIMTGCVVALTIAVVVVNRRTKVVTDVYLGENSLCVEYNNRSTNTYSLN